MDEQNDVMVETIPEPSAPATPDTPLSFTDDDMREAYRLADEQGMDEKQLMSMSEDELVKFIGKGKSTETQSETPAEEQSGEAGTAQTSAQPEAIAPDKDTAIQPTPDPNQKRIDDLLKLTGTQASELGQLRSMVDQYRPFLEALNDPRFQAHMMAFYNPSAVSGVAVQQQPQPAIELDPFNPQSVDQFVQHKVEAKLAEKERIAREAYETQQASLRMNTFRSGIQASIARTAAATGQPPEVLSGMVQNLIKQVLTGQNLADLAIIAANKDNMIAEAERRGEENAMKKLMATQSQKDVPRTVAAGVAQTSNKKSGETNDLSMMTEMELSEYINKQEPFSPEWERADKHGRNRFKWL